MTTRSISRIRIPRRARQWAIISTSGSVIAATEAAKITFDLQSGLESDLGFSLNNVTASALRYNLVFSFPGGSALGDTCSLMWGIAWLSNDAIAAGAASLPNPNTDHADWMAHGGAFIRSESITAHVPRGGLFQIKNDSMRKQRENNSTLAMIVSANVLASSVTVSLNGRGLFLLP